MEFFDENGYRLSIGAIYIGNVPSKSTRSFAIPISFQGQPPIQEWLVIGATGKRSDGRKFSAIRPGDNRGNLPLIIMDPEAIVDAKGVDSSSYYYLSYDGPTFDSAFSTPGLTLDAANLDLSFDDKTTAVDITGKVTNRTDHVLPYAEIDINFLNFRGGDIEESGKAHVENLDPGQSWNFSVPIVNGSEVRAFRVTKLFAR